MAAECCISVEHICPQVSCPYSVCFECDLQHIVWEATPVARCDLGMWTLLSTVRVVSGDVIRLLSRPGPQSHRARRRPNDAARCDFIHAATGTLIEVGESQHFTSFRLQTLQLYPADAALGFDLEH